MNLESVQDSIVAKLNDYFNDPAHSSLNCIADKLPDTDDAYVRAIAKSIVFVSITGSSTGNTLSTSPIIQERKVQVGVIAHARSMYGEAGLFAIQDAIEKTLLGFKPTNCYRLYHLKDERDKILEQNVWIHAYQFECKTMLVQDLAITETTYGNLVDLTYNPDTFNGT